MNNMKNRQRGIFMGVGMVVLALVIIGIAIPIYDLLAEDPFLGKVYLTLSAVWLVCALISLVQWSKGIEPDNSKEKEVG